MAVKREHVRSICSSGFCSPVAAERQANGRWSIELSVDLVIYLRDGREVHVKKHIRTQATEQRYRKPSKRSQMGKSERQP